MKRLRTIVVVAGLLWNMAWANAAIDRKALVERNSPRLEADDTLASLSVGNGGFAFTADITGLQTFPEAYSHGVPLGTQSQWGWHSFDNPQGLRIEESFKEYDFGHGHKELYATEHKEKGRARDAATWYRVNPHRLHLGCIGLETGKDVSLADVSDARQTLDLWQGRIDSRFTLGGASYDVSTVCHPQRDIVSTHIVASAKAAVNLRFAYPTGGHCDDACNWNANDRHTTQLVDGGKQWAVLKRTIDNTIYYIKVSWTGKATLKEKSPNYWVLASKGKELDCSCEFTQEQTVSGDAADFSTVAKSSAGYWADFWTSGAAVDFSECTDSRAAELERRVVLSQYLLAIQCAGSAPPQETGLTYNSWFGKFHLEMIWWHQSWLPLYGHGALLDRTLRWYESASGNARAIARRQGFEGLRWMKMTDPSAIEAPSKVGSFLIWQQPHIIYLAELLYRANPNKEILDRYGEMVDETAVWMQSFASSDTLNGRERFVLKGMIPAQETLRAAETWNSPFELSYWHFALQVAQQWRERRGLQRVEAWDKTVELLAPLAYNSDSLYLAAETATDTYSDIRLTSDHPAVLGAVGIFPMSRLVNTTVMMNTLNWIWDKWNWDKTWGWDYPMVAMNAARMGEPEKAVNALLMDKRTNTYLPNGHNYQDQRLRCYLPGNGGLLTAIAMMCAGWDGNSNRNPGFPRNGKWNVKWEGLKAMP